MATQRNRERGFTLLELMIVMLLLGIVAGGVFLAIDTAQQRSKTEQSKLDDQQQARDFVDAFFRDINQVGYPSLKMVDTTSASWSPALTTQSTYAWASPYINDNRLAMGLVRIDANELRFEADTNGDGTVQSVVYMLNGNGACAQCLQRSQVAKVAGDPITGQTPNWGTEVNDVFTTPIFQYYTTAGTLVTGLPLDITTLAGAQTLAQVKTIKITLNIQNNSIVDQKTGQPIQTTFEGEVSLNNCSMAASGQLMSCK